MEIFPLPSSLALDFSPAVYAASERKTKRSLRCVILPSPCVCPRVCSSAVPAPPGRAQVGWERGPLPPLGAWLLSECRVLLRDVFPQLSSAPWSLLFLTRRWARAASASRDGNGELAAARSSSAHPTPSPRLGSSLPRLPAVLSPSLNSISRPSPEGLKPCRDGKCLLIRGGAALRRARSSRRLPARSLAAAGTACELRRCARIPGWCWSGGQRCQWFSETEVTDQIPHSFFSELLLWLFPGRRAGCWWSLPRRAASRFWGGVFNSHIWLWDGAESCGFGAKGSSWPRWVPWAGGVGAACSVSQEGGWTHPPPPGGFPFRVLPRKASGPPAVPFVPFASSSDLCGAESGLAGRCCRLLAQLGPAQGQLALGMSPWCWL
ncbi:uncharacterized protein [Anas acuta]|uniref:uncharacterized protein n=1 Tax=Anas acuta TaxID=28680 RepID=UPI0035C8B1A4